MMVQASAMIGANIYVESDSPRYFKANKGLIGVIVFNLVSTAMAAYNSRSMRFRSFSTPGHTSTTDGGTRRKPRSGTRSPRSNVRSISTPRLMLEISGEYMRVVFSKLMVAAWTSDSPFENILQLFRAGCCLGLGQMRMEGDEEGREGEPAGAPDVDEDAGGWAG